MLFEDLPYSSKQHSLEKLFSLTELQFPLLRLSTYPRGIIRLRGNVCKTCTAAPGIQDCSHYCYTLFSEAENSQARCSALYSKSPFQKYQSRMTDTERESQISDPQWQSLFSTRLRNLLYFKRMWELLLPGGSEGLTCCLVSTRERSTHSLRNSASLCCVHLPDSKSYFIILICL